MKCSPTGARRLACLCYSGVPDTVSSPASPVSNKLDSMRDRCPDKQVYQNQAQQPRLRRNLALPYYIVTHKQA